MPRGYSKAFTERVRGIIKDNNIEYPKGYTIYGTDTCRGYCYFQKKIITIPIWTASKGEACILYTICHEIAHAFCDHDTDINHGPEFMEWFMLLCPDHLWHYELDYKPRLAAAAGIRK